jgi:hypothetical protein
MSMNRGMAAGIGLFVLLGAGVALAGDLVLVPEMQRPPGIVYEPVARRRELESRPESAKALEQLRRRVAELWPQLLKVDFVELSRYQVEATRGFRLPAEPGELEGHAVGRDEKDGRLYLELRGPRLPASHAIVYRYLYFYSSFDPATGELGPVIATIRGWVEE